MQKIKEKAIETVKKSWFLKRNAFRLPV